MMKCINKYYLFIYYKLLLYNRSNFGKIGLMDLKQKLNEKYFINYII